MGGDILTHKSDSLCFKWRTSLHLLSHEAIKRTPPPPSLGALTPSALPPSPLPFSGSQFWRKVDLQRRWMDSIFLTDLFCSARKYLSSRSSCFFSFFFIFFPLFPSCQRFLVNLPFRSQSQFFKPKCERAFSFAHLTEPGQCTPNTSTLSC